MRYFDASDCEPLKRNRESDMRFGSWIKTKVEDAISKRFWLDQEWREDVRAYESIPTLKSTDVAADTGQLDIEIPVGAAMVDSIASAVYDLIFNTSPVFSVRCSPGYESHAYAFQLLAAKLLDDEFVNFMPAANEVIVDTVMLGTGAFYVVSTREVLKKAGFKENKLGPRVYSIPIEDVVVPGGTMPDVNDMQLIAHRDYMLPAELEAAAQLNGWDVDEFKIASNIEWVRQRRIEASRESVDLETVGGMYEIFYVHCQYDYDGDGLAEDLFAVWDRTSYELGYAGYAAYDSRPFVFARYQIRPHIFYGLGVQRMANPFEREVTEWHNFKMKNAHLSNSRVWAYRLGAVGIGEELKISPNKAIGLGNPREDLVELRMSDNYPTAQQYESATIALAEMRVGTPAVGPAQKQGIAAGKRVPAGTAAAALQQQNRRFAAPFDNIRRACAGALTQCFMRMREQYEKGKEWRHSLMDYLVYTVGVKNAGLIEEVFKKSQAVDLRDKVIIETTATAQTINRMADRQSAVERIQVMGQYYEKAMQLGQVLLNPKTPPPLKQLMVDVSNGVTESIRAFLRTFDDVRDPDQFIPQIFKQIDMLSRGGDQGNEQDQGGGGAPGGEPGGSPAEENPQQQSGTANDDAESLASQVRSSPDPLEGSSELGRGAEDTGING